MSTKVSALSYNCGLRDEDGTNDPMEYSFRVKFVTDECLRGLSMWVSSIVTLNEG